jgi:hypothetical protein
LFLVACPEEINKKYASDEPRRRPESRQGSYREATGKLQGSHRKATGKLSSQDVEDVGYVIRQCQVSASQSLDKEVKP